MWFGGQPSPGSTENRLRERKYPLRGSWMQENALLMSEWSVTRLDPLCLGSPQGPSHWLELHIENDQPVACVALLTGTVSGESRGWIAWVEWLAGRSCSVAHQFLLWWHATLCWFDLEWTVGFSENQSLACGVAQDKQHTAFCVEKYLAFSNDPEVDISFEAFVSLLCQMSEGPGSVWQSCWWRRPWKPLTRRSKRGEGRPPALGPSDSTGARLKSWPTLRARGQLAFDWLSTGWR